MIAKVLKIDLTPGGDNNAKDVARIKEILRTWLKNKVLATETRLNSDRKEREFIIPGPWNPEPETATADEANEEF